MNVWCFKFVVETYGFISKIWLLYLILLHLNLSLKKNGMCLSMLSLSDLDGFYFTLKFIIIYFKIYVKVKIYFY